MLRGRAANAPAMMPARKIALSSAVHGQMQRFLLRNRGYRRDMAHGPRMGALYVAEVFIEARLIIDSPDRQPISMKRLIGEVVPEWISESTAMRLLHQLAAEGLLVLEPNPEDGRSVLVRCTGKLIVRNHERWARIVDEPVAAVRGVLA
jgi:hypothetical protein